VIAVQRLRLPSKVLMALAYRSLVPIVFAVLAIGSWFTWWLTIPLMVMTALGLAVLAATFYAMVIASVRDELD
jgi:hypothetical protein